MRRFTVACVFCVLIAPFERSVRAEDPPRRLTLAEAEQAAIATHERLQVAAAERRRADVGAWRAATLLAPSITESASFEHQKDEIAFPAPDATGQPSDLIVLQKNAGRSVLTVLQPLFRGQFAATRDLSRVDRGRAAEAERGVRQDVLLDVAEAYYGALRAAALADVAREAVSLAEVEADHAKARVDAGESVASDVVRARTEIEDTWQQLVEATGALEIAKRRLSRACGIPEPFELEDPPEPPTTAAAAAVSAPGIRHALTENTEVRQARLGADAAHAEESRRRAALYPTLDARFQYRLVDNEAFAERNDFWHVGAYLEVPIIEAGGARWLDFAEQKARVVAAEADVRRVSKDLELAVAEAEIRVRTLAGREVAATESERLSIETHRQISEQYAAGEATSVDVLSALTARNRARATLATVRYDRRLALVRLQRLTGDLEGDSK